MKLRRMSNILKITVTDTVEEACACTGGADEKTKVTKTIVVSSPITGVAADLSTAPDEAFAGRMMGDGAVVTPTGCH